MRISGFTMVKNGTKLYYPVKESIMSIIPIVDEFVVALGDCDPDDRTLAEIESINSPKVKIIDQVWDIVKYPNGTENAHQTDIAKSHCSGDWLFYLQADEVIHEKYLNTIVNRCSDLLGDKEVEGLLFKYMHFWGDYTHYQLSHGWYKNEIRIIRNDPEIHSWESAQSFRRIPGFDGKNYRQQEGTYKLNVAALDAYVYHYGWVRPPEFMQNKKKALDTIHKGTEKVNQIYKSESMIYDYGAIGRAKKFDGTHPKVMEDMISRFNWGDKLNYSSSLSSLKREKMKHERFKYRLLSFLEQTFLGGSEIGGFKNYNLLKR